MLESVERCLAFCGPLETGVFLGQSMEGFSHSRKAFQGSAAKVVGSCREHTAIGVQQLSQWELLVFFELSGALTIELLQVLGNSGVSRLWLSCGVGGWQGFYSLKESCNGTLLNCHSLTPRVDVNSTNSSNSRRVVQ